MLYPPQWELKNSKVMLQTKSQIRLLWPSRQIAAHLKNSHDYMYIQIYRHIYMHTYTYIHNIHTEIFLGLNFLSFKGSGVLS